MSSGENAGKSPDQLLEPYKQEIPLGFLEIPLRGIRPFAVTRQTGLSFESAPQIGIRSKGVTYRRDDRALGERKKRMID